MFYNNVPHFNPYILTEMIFGKTENINLRHEYKLIKDFNVSEYTSKDDSDVLGSLFQKFNIPNVKSLRTRILKHPGLFSGLIFYSRIFTDVNLLNNILDSLIFKNKIKFEFSSNDVINYFSNNENDCDYTHSIQDCIYKITKCLVDTFGETIAAKKITGAYKNNQLRDLEDIWPMYELHLRLYPGEPVDLTGNIKEIHDRLIGLTGGSQIPFTEKDFKPFKYAKKEKELESEIEGHSFKLVYDGRELAILGNNLKNCVRSYSERVRSKHCLIVSATYDNKYKICIELLPTNNDNLPDGEDYNYILKQAKLFANKPVSEDNETLKIVLEWMEINKIKSGSQDVITTKPKRTRFVENENQRIEIAPLDDINLNLDFLDGTDDEYDEALPF